MSKTFQRMYKQSLQFAEQGYPSAPEHQSSLSENTPESPVKSPLYAELGKCLVFVNLNLESYKILRMFDNDDNPFPDGSSQARSVVGAPPKTVKSPAVPTVNTAIINSSPKTSNPKKIRHRRLGSADSNYTFILPPMSIDRRNIKMVHMETQTETMDTSIDISPCASINQERATNLNAINETVITSTTINASHNENHETCAEQTQTEDFLNAIHLNNGNLSDAMTIDQCNDTVDHYSSVHSRSKSREDIIDDFMNSNEHIEIRESSDEDNLDTLNRRVSQFFTENCLLQQTDNGNGSIIDSRALMNVMAARRSCISINDKDEVTIMSRGNSFRTNSIHGESMCRRNSNYKISDHNCNNDDGDDSWTDEEGEESDRDYPLRRKW